MGFYKQFSSSLSSFGDIFLRSAPGRDEMECCLWNGNAKISMSVTTQPVSDRKHNTRTHTNTRTHAHTDTHTHITPPENSGPSDFLFLFFFFKGPCFSFENANKADHEVVMRSICTMQPGCQLRKEHTVAFWVFCYILRRGGGKKTKTKQGRNKREVMHGGKYAFIVRLLKANVLTGGNPVSPSQSQ